MDGVVCFAWIGFQRKVNQKPEYLGFDLQFEWTSYYCSCYFEPGKVPNTFASKFGSPTLSKPEGQHGPITDI